MKLSHFGQEWLQLAMQLTESHDTVVQETIRERMNKLWYYYVSPTDKKLIERMQEQQ